MDKKTQIIHLITEQKLLPLFFNKEAEVSIEVLRALYEAGVRTLEYTNRGEAALQNFKQLRKVCEEELKGMYLGVGTIKNGEAAKAFIDAGADFIISPGLVEEVAGVAEQQGLLWVPGCMTPTEIIRAEALGAAVVKLFPGNLLGPAFVSAIKELFAKVKFMPTGGVEAEEGNLRGWFSAGVAAVGMGSKLITKELVQQRDYQGLKRATEKALQLIKKVTTPA